MSWNSRSGLSGNWSKRPDRSDLWGDIGKPGETGFNNNTTQFNYRDTRFNVGRLNIWNNRSPS